jgi:Tyrosine phosphatase family
VRRRTWMGIALGSIAAPLASYSAWQWRDEWVEKRIAVVSPGRIIRGAWQRPGPLRRIVSRERIKTILTLTAISRDDPKYVDQAKVVRELGVDWVLMPIHGSYASLDQMEQAALILADPARQPIFYHCVAGHHRSSQAQAAYRIQHDGWSASRAWDEVAALPWAKPDKDLEDHRLIEAFASSQLHRKKDASDAPSTVAKLGPPRGHGICGGDWFDRRLDVPDIG